MSLYTLELFLHVSGAIGVFAGIGIWLFGLSALRRARRVEQVRAIAWLIIVTIPFMVVSLVLIGAAGLVMAISTWGFSHQSMCLSLILGCASFMQRQERRQMACSPMTLSSVPMTRSWGQ
jgi:ABC-type methionine transport system permease subunit